MRRVLATVTMALLAALTPRPASAALTDAEKAQIRAFVESGEPGKAARVRALVARPDLDPSEAAEPLQAGYARAPFDDSRAAFTRALLFGPGSVASRNALVLPVVLGLLARAAHVTSKLPPSSEALHAGPGERAGLEIVRIHRFVADEIANAGSPPPAGHDASQGIRDDALRAAADAYGDHLESHSKWFTHGSPAEGVLLRARAQAHQAAVDLARGLVPRHDVATWLGLEGARRGLFERHGVVLEDDGTAPAERIEAAVAMLEAAPAALVGTSLFAITKGSLAGLSPKRVAVARTALTDAPPMLAGERLWPSVVHPSTPDAQLAEVAFAVAWRATRRVLGSRPALRASAEALARRAEAVGTSAYPSRAAVVGALSPVPSDTAGVVGASGLYVVAHALHLLLLDAPRVLDLALARWAEGRREPMEQIALALATLAMSGSDVDAVPLGRTLPDGRIERMMAKVALDGERVRTFTVGGVGGVAGTAGREFRFEGSGTGAIERVLVDGAVPNPSRLASVRVETRTASAFKLGNVELSVISGAPRALELDGGALRIGAADPSGGFDALGVGDDVEDAEVRARIKAKGPGGGLVLRASKGETTYRGVVIFVSAVPSGAHLVHVDGKGGAFSLAGPVKVAPSAGPGFDVRLTIKGDEIVALVDRAKLTAKLPAGLGAGRAGVALREGGEIEIAELLFGKPGRK